MNINSLTKKYIYVVAIIFVVIFLITISTCHSGTISKQKSKKQIVSVRLHSAITHLYYSGIVKPIQVKNIVSPVDGVIKNIFFRYGDSIKKDQLLLTISSSKAQENYTTALTNYVKDKDQYLRNKNSFEASVALYKAGIIGKEDYLSQKSQFETSQLAYINSSNIIKKIAQTIPGANKNLENLSLENLEVIQNIFERSFEEFKIVSPIDGIVLLPEKGRSENEVGADKVILEGSDIKQNQILVSIGEMSGISVVINTGENDINFIKLGEPAILSSPVFPGMLLYGTVTHVSQQASSNRADEGGIAVFPVEITVPDLSTLQRKLIRIGINVKIDILIHEPPQVRVPIQAVFDVNGNSMVTRIDSKTMKKETVHVETGKTGLFDIVILKGLNPGDKVIVY